MTAAKFDPTGAKHRTVFYENFDQAVYADCSGRAVRAYQSRVIRAIPDLKNARYLELGSHALELTRQVIDRVGQNSAFTAVDIAASGELARSRASQLSINSRGNSVRLLQGDVSDMPIRSGSIDAVFHGCLMHHLDRPLSAINEIRRVVRPGGVVVYYLPCDPGLLLRLAQKAVTQRAAKKLMTQNGLSVAFLWSIEHRNHYKSLRQMITYVHQHDIMISRVYPFGFHSWNLNLFEIVTVTKQ